MIKVFISSKQGELDPERAALHQALQSSEWDNFTIEFSGAFPDSVRDVFLQNVAECDVYLGIFASIYSQPTVDEYRKAKELGKPILIYLKKSVDRESSLDDFIRAELQPSHKYQEFSTTEELVSYLPDIRRALDAEVQKHQRQAYLDALVSQTELLELAGIVDPGEQERPKLQDIFVALSAEEEEDGRKSSVKIKHRVTINEALHKHPNLMILGDPGAGKSTLLQYLTLVAAQGGVESPAEKLGLPILIRLSSFVQSGQSFIEYFASYAEKQLHVSLGKKFFERTLEDGQAIVCLDSFDEVSQPARRIDVRNAITVLATRYPRNRFIVTSRLAGYESTSLDKKAFAHHTIMPFGEKEIQSFVQKWYMAREHEPERARTRAASLFDDLKANERLLKLAENPLTLTIIALVHQRAQGKLPDARVELYDRCAETLIEEWDKWKGLAPEDRERPYYRLRRRLLERAASWMHIESQEADVAQVNKRALEIKVAEFLVEDKTLNLSEDTARIEAKMFIALTTNRTGILVEREQGSASFIHLTFQEYFAASDLYWRYRRTPDALWQVLQPQLYDSRWLEVILLLLGHLNNDGDIPSILVEKILGEQDKFDDVIQRNLFLAARCLADGATVHESLQNKIVDALLKFAGNGPDYLRHDSIRALGSLNGNMRVGEGLIRLVQDENMNARVRIESIQALQQMGGTDDAERVFSTLAQDEKADVGLRLESIKALHKMGSTHDAGWLLLALVQDDKLASYKRIDAVKVLANLRCTDDGVIQGLTTLTQDEKVDAEVRIKSIQVLQQMGYTDGAGRLLLALVQDNKLYSGTRIDAVKALEDLPCVEDEIIQGLTTLTQDEKVDAKVRIKSIQVLQQMGYTDGAGQLLLALVQGKKPYSVLQYSNSQIEAAKALEDLQCVDDVVIQGLITLTQDENVAHSVRTAIGWTLKELGHTEVAEKLFLALAQDEKSYVSVRFESIRALQQMGHSETWRLLLALILGENLACSTGFELWEARESAANALGNLGNTNGAVIQGLLALVESGNRVFWEWERGWVYDLGPTAAQALHKLGQTDHAARILLSLADGGGADDEAICKAAIALGELGKTHDAITCLLKRADSDNAINGLVRLGQKDSRVALKLFELANYSALKRMVGNLRYSDLDDTQIC